MATTTTMISRPAESPVRRDVEKALDWMTDLPAFVSKDDCAAIMTRLVGHDIDPDALRDAVAALILRNRYCGTDAEIDAQQREFEIAVDRLLDVTKCEACHTVIDDGTSRIVCNESAGAEFCDDGCHGSWHMGARCDAGSDR